MCSRGDDMGRPLKYIDETLDALLDMDDLKAVGGDENHIIAMTPDTEIPICDRCHKKMKNQDSRDRELMDVIKLPDGKYKVISLCYRYYRYRCINKECTNYGKIERKDISFAANNAWETYRFDERIVRMAMFLSYRKIENLAGVMVAKSSVSNIVRRWVKMKDDERGEIYTPESLGLLTHNMFNKIYTIVFDADDKDMHIIEVIPSTSTNALANYLNKLNKNKLKYVFTDSNDVVINVVSDTLYNAEIMVMAESILDEAKAEFKYLLNLEARQVYTNYKKLMFINPFSWKEGDESRVKDVLKDRPHLERAYDHISSLISILERDDWDVMDIYSWNEKVKLECKDEFSITSEYIDVYWNELLNYYKRRTVIVGEAYDKIKSLNYKVMRFKRYSSYSDEILRARILYTSEADYINEQAVEKWRGIKIDNVLAALNELINEMEAYRHEQQKIKE